MTPKRAGLTLIELVVVLLILVALATLVLPTLSGTIEASEERAVFVKMVQLREAIIGAPGRPGFRSHNPRIPLLKLDQLYRQGPAPDYDPARKLGWGGPYADPLGAALYIPGDRNFTLAYGNGSDELAPIDPYGNLDQPCFLVLQATTPGPPQAPDPADAVYQPRLVSAGPNRIIDTPIERYTAAALSGPNLGARGDDIVIFLDVADPDAPNPLKD